MVTPSLVGGRFIETGIEDTAMPAFGETLTVIDIWNLINFLQTLPP